MSEAFPAATRRRQGRRLFALVLALIACWSLFGMLVPAADASPAALQAREWWINRLGLSAAWKISQGAGITVAVLDSGVDTSVGDLRGATVPGFSVDTTLPPTHAWDKIGHGTSMATTIAGRGTNPGILGVAPKAKVMPVYLADSAPPTTVGALNRLSAMAHPPQIANMSYGANGACPADVQAAVAKAVGRGIMLVASAGNDGDSTNATQWPSNCKGVVAVGAFDYNAKPWVHTQRQPYVSLGGPGVNIVTYNKDLHSGTANGTSQSAAMVSGELALLKAHFPRLTSRQIVARLFATASKSTYHGPHYGQPGDTLGFGPALPHQALIRNISPNAPNPVYDDLAKLSAPSTSTSPPLPESPSGAPRTSAVNFPGTDHSDSPAAESSSGASNTAIIVAAVVGGLVLIGVAAFLLSRRIRGRGAGPQ